MAEEPDKLIDYYVGLLRGYCIALNAPTQILHALDILLTGYRSRAGEVIGNIPSPNNSMLEELRKAAEGDKIVAENRPELFKYNKPWTNKDEEELRKLKQANKTHGEIARTLGRSLCAIHGRVNIMKNEERL